jgi:hypothetical protein
MNKPDVIVTWPRNCDYPLWRKFIAENRNRFAKVIIVFMETNDGDDYRPFIKSVLSPGLYDLVESPAPAGNEDWRNVAVCEGLKHSTAEWVWFTEQDFFVKNDLFWSDVERAADRYEAEAVGVMQGTRLHPCSLFVKREIINRTHCDFGIVPNVSDHFSIFTNDLQNMHVPTAIVTDDLYKHYNGLSHNWSLVSKMQKPVYKADEFVDYLMQCLNAGVELDVRFVRVAQQAIQSYLPTEESTK